MFGIFIKEDLEMRYTGQDTSQEDESKFENCFEAIKWRWDFKNITAFLVVFIFALFYFHALAILWYEDNLPSLAFRDESLDELIRFVLSFAFESFVAPSLRQFSFINFWLIDVLTRLCSIFEVPF